MPVDHRFYTYKGPQTLRTLSSICGFEAPETGEFTIDGIAPFDRANPTDIGFFEGSARQVAEITSQAGACLIRAEAAEGLPKHVRPLIVKRPRFAHILASKALYDLKSWQEPGAPATVHETAQIGPGVFLGSGAAIGACTIIGPNAVIGPGVQIGENCRIGANVSVRCALIGNGVTLLSGARIGESGFGVTLGDNGAEDVPQWGRAILQDYVTIGANTCIDRGAFDDTIIGERTRIDNLCQIAHNVVIGRNVMIASFAGISGSTTIGDGVIMGGQVGIADHVKVGRGAKLAAAAGIFRDVPEGQAWGGSPGRPLREYLKQISWLHKQTAPRKTKS